MKKNVVKLLSAVLALVLVLSAMPMMVFAEETTEHVHEDACCAEENVSVTAACTHVFSVKENYVYTQYSSGMHLVTANEIGTCTLCNYKTIISTSTYYEVHKDWFTNSSGDTCCGRCGYVK